MSKLKTIEYIFGDSFTQSTINLLQDYFQVNWIFAKDQFIYYIDPESGNPMCKPKFILAEYSNKYKFKQITIETIKEYVNRLQKQENDLNRGDQQPTSGIQCTTSKAKIGKANLSF